MAVPNMVIECSDELQKKIEDHCFSETQIEVGGFLVGKIIANVTTVTHVLPAKKTVGKSTNLTFTHDTWTELYKDIEDLKTDSVIIGWYHSHPNFGVFLSEHDKFIQNNYFKENGQITTVVDPIRGRRGWWYSSDEKIVTYGKEADTTKDRLGESATDSEANMDAVFEAAKPTGGVSLGKVIAISAAMSLLSFLAGWGMTALNAGSASSNEAELQSLRDQVQQIQMKIGNNGIAPEKIPTAPIASSRATKAPTKNPAAVKTSSGTSVTSPTPTKSQKQITKVKHGGKCDTAGGLGKEGTTNLVCVLKAGNLVWLTNDEKKVVENAPKPGASCSSLAKTGVSNEGVNLTCGKSGKSIVWMTLEEYTKAQSTSNQPPADSPQHGNTG